MMAHAAERTLFVHLGTHKTGTTSIQAFLGKQRTTLADRGLFVPTAGTLGPTSGHHNLAWELRGDRRFDPAYGTLDGLASELACVKQPCAAISSEDFEYCVQYPDKLQHFEAIVRKSGWDPSYIVFFRGQGTYASSLYAELRKHGLTIHYEAFVARIIATGRFIMHRDWCFWFDYLAFLRRWGRATTGTTWAYGYSKSEPSGSLIATFLDAVRVRSADLSAAAAEAGVLNIAELRRGSLGLHLSAAILRARFARSNAKLREAYGVDLGTG